ncbi:MAG: hypothetical protein P8Q84_07535, partial [Luminiphilus sp.]|nr:hypothetical protein [Luminiphilus sp.]
TFNEASEGITDAITEVPQLTITQRTNINSPAPRVTIPFTLMLWPNPNSMEVGTPIFKSLG